MPDADLLKGLRAAKGKPQYFAFIPKGPADGKLIVSKAKVKAKDIAAAKKEIGGGNPITGKCFGSIAEMVFTTAKAAPATLKNAIKIVSKRDAGVPVIAEFQLAADADVDEGESEGEEADTSLPPTAPPPPPSAPQAQQATGGDAKITGIQKALAKLGFDPGAIDGVSGPKTQDAVRKFQQAHGLAADGIAGPKTQAAIAKALKGEATPPPGDTGGGSPDSPRDAAPPAPPPLPETSGDAADGDGSASPRQLDLRHWLAARQNAINGLKALAAKVAGTKHGDAAGVVKEIAGLIAKLPANPAPQDIDRLEAFIINDEAITAAEQSPKHFHDLNLRQPLLDALETLKHTA